MLINENGTLVCTECGRVYDAEEGLTECPADDCPSNCDDDYDPDYPDGVEDDDYVVTGCEFEEYDSGDQYDMEYDRY
jgi:hypothetical protein